MILPHFKTTSFVLVVLSLITAVIEAVMVFGSKGLWLSSAASSALLVSWLLLQEPNNHKNSG